MEQVSKRVFVDPDYGGCTVGAIVTDAGVILVDSPKQPSRSRDWLNYIAAFGDVRYLINTEHHVDHTFGNAFLPGTVVANKAISDRFWEDSPIGPNPMKSPRDYIKRTDPSGLALAQAYVAREPELTFDSNMTIAIGGVRVELILMPGHTAAETAVYIPEEGVLFASDNVFNRVMIWYHDALPFQWLTTLENMQRMAVDLVVPGHGPPAGPELLVAMHESVSGVIHQVVGAIEGGISREEAIARLEFADWHMVAEDHRAFAPQLQKYFVGHLYDEISRWEPVRT